MARNLDIVINARNLAARELAQLQDRLEQLQREAGIELEVDSTDLDDAATRARKLLRELERFDPDQLKGLREIFNFNTSKLEEAIASFIELRGQSEGLNQELIKTVFTAEQLAGLSQIDFSGFDLGDIRLKLDDVDLTTEQVRELNAALNDIGKNNAVVKVREDVGKARKEEKGKKKGGGILEGIQNIGKFSFLARQALSEVQVLFDSTLGGAIRLQDQLLEIQATVAALNDISIAGREVTDPTQAILAAEAPVNRAIARLREKSLELAGVTSDELIGVFKIINADIGQVGGGIEDAVDLTASFAASLTTLGIPLFQARQEVQSILQGQVTINSALAKQLGITNAQLALERSRGTTIEFLTGKLKALEAGQALRAKTFAGVTSNIAEQFERLGETAGAAILPKVVELLDRLFNAIKGARPEVEAFATKFGEFFSSIADSSVPAFEQFGNVLGVVGRAAQDLFNALEPLSRAGFEISAGASAVFFKALADSIDFVAQGYRNIADAAGLATGATEAYIEANDAIARASVPIFENASRIAITLRRLNEEQQINGTLSEKQRKRQEILQKQAQLELERIKDRIAVLKRLRAERVGNQSAITNEINSLEKLVGVLSNTEIQQKKIADQGTIFSQIQNQVTQALDALKQTRGLPDLLNQRAKELLTQTQQQLTLGAIGGDEAEARLRQIVESGQIEIGLRIQALEALQKVDEQQTKRRVAALNAQQKEVELAQQSGTLSELEALEQGRILKTEQIDVETRQIIANLELRRDLILDQLEQTRKAAESEAIAAERALRLDPRDIRAKRTLEIKKAEVEEFTRQIASVTRESEIEIGQARLDQQNKLQELEVQQAKKFIEIRTRELQRANQLALQTAERSEIEANEAIAQIRLKGFDNESELALQQLAAQRQVNQQRIAAQQELIAGLEALPEPLSQVEREERIQQLQAERLKLARLTSQELESQVKLQQLLAEQALVPLKRQQQALETISKLLASNNELRDAELDLQKAITDSAIAAGEINLQGLKLAQELRKSIFEREKAQNEDLAKTRLKDLEEEKKFADRRGLAAIEFEQKQLELQEQGEDAEKKARVEAIKDALQRQRLAELGLSTGSSEEAIAQQVFNQEQELLKLKRQQFEEQQAAAQLSLEFSIQEREIRNKQLEIEAQIALTKALASKDRTAIAQAQALVGLVGVQLSNSEKIADTQRQSLALQQETERQRFNVEQDEAAFQSSLTAADAGIFLRGNRANFEARPVNATANPFTGLDRVTKNVDQTAKTGRELVNSLNKSTESNRTGTPEERINRAIAEANEAANQVSDAIEDKVGELINVLDGGFTTTAKTVDKLAIAVDGLAQKVQVPAPIKASGRAEAIGQLIGVQPRRKGGDVVAGVPYIVNEAGTESFTAGNVTQTIPGGTQIVRFSESGRVNSAPQTRRILEQIPPLASAAGLNPDTLAKAIVGAMAGNRNQGDLAVNNNFYNDPRPDYTAYRVARQLMAIR